MKVVPEKARLFTRDFVLVCLTSFASAVGMQFLMPTLPLYVKSMGGLDSDVGLLLGVYSLSALGSRFVAGPLLDLWGRKWPLVAGTVLYLMATLLYSVATTVPSIVLLRLFHGFGFGLVTTSCAALVADLAPPQRRAEAMGYFGNFASVAMALGPGIALWLVDAPGLPLGGYGLLFVVCDVVAALEVAIALRLSETRRPPARSSAPAGRLGLASVFSRDALPIAVAMLFAAFVTAALIGFVAVYLSTEDTRNVPLFYFCFAAVMLASRPFVGSLADRVDRRFVVIPLMLLCIAGTSILAMAPSLPVALASAIIFGLGWGSLSPTLLATVVDMVKPRERGAAVATFFASIDVGIGVGSVILGMVADAYGYRAVFLVAGAVGFLGLAQLLVCMPARPRPQTAGER